MRCLNCGNELPGDVAFCDNCGCKVEKDISINEEMQSDIKVEFCGNCGSKLANGSAFCGECGASNNVEKIDANYTFCGECGARNLEGTQICNSCGKNLYGVNSDFAKNDKNRSRTGYRIVIVLILVILAMVAALFAYFSYSDRGKEENETKIEATTAPAVTSVPTPTITPTVTPGLDAVKMETYYVVNCNQSISLREAPETSAKVLKDVSLGEPVSYVEPAENGFAKVIYNGTTGYALQSYLSDDYSDVRKDDNNNSSGVTNDGGQSGNSQRTNGVVRNPSYDTYKDTKYNFNCAYPTHFAQSHSDDPFVIRAYEATDGTATLNICGTNNSSNLSVKTVHDNFKLSYPGTVDYENKGDDWCVCRTYKNGIYHYGYFSLKDGMIRGFEMHFDGDYYTVYDGYVNDIYDSLKF